MKKPVDYLEKFPDATPGAKLVWLYIASKGEPECAYATLSTALGLSVKTAQNSIGELLERGLIRLLRDSSGRTPAIYTVILPQ
jgi:DNA-binding MarR family transcriptional regulator